MSDCSCEVCQSYCQNRAGMFAPGEAEIAAAHLGLSLEEFFLKHCTIDYWENDDYTQTYYLMPVHKDETPGTVKWSFDHLTGECSFFANGLCGIHAVKPMECRLAHHDNAKHGKSGKSTVVDLWRTEEAQQQMKYLISLEKEEINESK